MHRQHSSSSSRISAAANSAQSTEKGATSGNCDSAAPDTMGPTPIAESSGAPTIVANSVRCVQAQTMRKGKTSSSDAVSACATRHPSDVHDRSSSSYETQTISRFGDPATCGTPSMISPPTREIVSWTESGAAGDSARASTMPSPVAAASYSYNVKSSWGDDTNCDDSAKTVGCVRTCDEKTYSIITAHTCAASTRFPPSGRSTNKLELTLDAYRPPSCSVVRRHAETRTPDEATDSSGPFRIASAHAARATATTTSLSVDRDSSRLSRSSFAISAGASASPSSGTSAPSPSPAPPSISIVSSMSEAPTARVNDRNTMLVASSAASRGA
mmetsp:Transcript_1260/g.3930  ORF Transcript_1260/g.3930 Transcript_1260/m.3930 type:complete len:329 (-) Transcript_1260:1970-2956(-)